jgi:uncharacterized protein YebE (UPF0316 family)
VLAPGRQLRQDPCMDSSLPLVAADSPLVVWVLLPLAIFVARTFDMSLSTLRIVFIAQGRRRLAPLVGFFESLIWLVVVGQAIKHLDNPLCVLAYAGGFAFGNLAGLTIESRLAMGRRLVRIILPGEDHELVDALRADGQGVTVLPGHGVAGPVQLLFTIVRRRDVEKVLATVDRVHPSAFVSIEDIRQAHQGTYFAPQEGESFWRRLLARKAR